MMFRELRESIQSEETQLLLFEYHDLAASEIKGLTTGGTEGHSGRQ